MRALALLLALAAGPAAAQVWRDPSQPIDKRVDDLVARLTLEEKAAQMQDGTPGIPRLGIPPYSFWNEALHGVARAGEATVFPQAIGMAATWDKALIRAEGEAIAIEARAKFNRAQREGNRGRYFGLTFWSPNINIFRDPRWGRGQETLGEDPYLTGILATQFIRGIQEGPDPGYAPALAAAKHLAVHSGPEPLRHGFDVRPSRQDLAETYLPAFRRTVIEGQVASIMCAYNALDGKPACANPELLTGLVRRDWGFKGYVVSDCGAIDDIATGHHFTKSNVEAVAAAVKAGTDLACDMKDEYLDIPKAVRAGLLAEAEVDAALKRVLAGRMRLGLFDPPEWGRYAAIHPWENHNRAHQDLAARAAQESIVLLSNDGILPLAPRKRIAVIGPGAASLISLEGNYNGTPIGATLPVDALGGDYAQGSAFVEGAAVPVPRTALKGVHASFYAGTELAGAPVAVVEEKEIDHNWNWIAPAAGVDPHSFSVRWEGILQVPAAGDYSFELQRRRCDAAAEVERYAIRLEGAEPLRVESACSARDAGEGRVVRLHAPDARPRRLAIEYAHRSPSYAPAITFAWQAPAEALRSQAVAVAEQADVVVAFVGLTAWLEGEEMPVKVAGFEGGDRTDIRLPEVQRRLLAALEATGKPVVIVLQSGSAVALGTEGRRAAAVLEAWYGGEKGGEAVSAVLSGAVNPAGRLPVTFYAANDQLPPFADYAMASRTYRYFRGAPEYPFGHGLSYTRFAYSRLSVAKPRVRAGEGQEVRVTVRNAGGVAGDEVVQLYLETPSLSGMPRRSLKGFERVHLAKGETRTVSFLLAPRDLAFADAAGAMRVRAADYSVWVGGGQPRTGAPGSAASFRVTGEAVMPR
ncbi:MAG: glycoside hydrolase family 3 C-terminal domain-containing protein [Alphaproteobacteria bacterium]|nr:glycoside hydrolase family 3 C-terminal domain-containing protein [Alphaproteobacteria bacterium]